MRFDVVLIHAPALYDFRKVRRHYGPISDLVPSTPVFDLYPIGFLSLANYLGKRGFRVFIMNLAARMLVDPGFDVEKAIRSVEADVYGVDLHWLVHAQGALEISRLVKECHPDSKVVMGGLSATIYHREILKRYPWVDCVVLGDTTEDAFLKLAESVVDGRGRLEDVPNLSWRDSSGRIRTTGLRPAPKSLDPYAIDYAFLFRQAAKSGDPLSFLPFARFLQEPIGAVLAFKGCAYSCVTCGGSRFTYFKFFGRRGLAVKSPETMASEIMSIQEYMKIPVFIVGDTQLLGAKWVEALASELRERGFDSTLIIEFFKPPTREFLEVVKSVPGAWFLQISPESQEERVRWRFGRHYGNEELESFISNALSMGFERLDLYFMVGLPLQTLESAAGIPRYVESLYRRIGSKARRLDAFVGPLAPFVDPGSPAFCNPKAFGYRLLARTLEEHRRLVEQASSWEEMLNYETEWLTREGVAEATYTAVEGLTRVKARYGIITEEDAEEMIESIARARAREPTPDLLERETLPRGELYPSRAFLKSLTPKALGLGALFLLSRSLSPLRGRRR
ncbi:hypothetical protein JCM10135_07540 [Stetteria hydrogenophila]